MKSGLSRRMGWITAEQEMEKKPVGSQYISICLAIPVCMALSYELSKGILKETQRFEFSFCNTLKEVFFCL